jgi:retron-type reverse transcriptase
LGGGIRRKIYHNIFREIISLENLFLAWDEFRKGKKNRKDVQEFEFNLEDNIFQLYQDLENKTYKHSKYASFYIQDPKLRHIHKATVRDRIIHHLVSKFLEQIYDKDFTFDSYSCRIRKGTHKAIKRLDKFSFPISKNNTSSFYALKCDIRKFFDSIDHKILIDILKKRIKDIDFLWLISEIINSFYSGDKNKGIPLGNLTSQHFANIYLNPFDKFIKHKLKAKYYIRYTDDFVILDTNRDYLEKIINLIEEFLNDNLKLSLHPNKIIIRKHHQGIDFLGYVSLPHCRILRTKTKIRMFKKIKSKIEDFKNGKISEESLNQTIQSYLGVLSHCNSYKLKKKLNGIIKI